MIHELFGSETVSESNQLRRQMTSLCKESENGFEIGTRLIDVNTVSTDARNLPDYILLNTVLELPIYRRDHSLVLIRDFETWIGHVKEESHCCNM